MNDLAVIHADSVALAKDRLSEKKKTKEELEFDNNTSAETRQSRFEKDSGVIDVVREGSGRRSKITGFSHVLQ